MLQKAPTAGIKHNLLSVCIYVTWQFYTDTLAFKSHSWDNDHNNIAFEMLQKAPAAGIKYSLLSVCIYVTCQFYIDTLVFKALSWKDDPSNNKEAKQLATSSTWWNTFRVLI